MMADLGLTHVAFSVRDLDASITFYKTYARMSIVSRRADEGGVRVAWLTDHRHSRGRTVCCNPLLCDFPSGRNRGVTADIRQGGGKTG
jgi:lactoylglutathione lyase